jgi:two-component system, NtrC family, response regulator HydG
MNKILIVDDDVDICNLLSKFLTRHGYEVHSSHTGSQAIEFLKKQKVDLVLCDFRLGDMDGSQVLTKVKELLPEAQVIIITGYSDIKIAVNVIKAGAYDYVTKPLLPDEILHTIKKALDTPVEHPAMAAASSVAVNKGPKIRANNDSKLPPDLIIGESSVSKELWKQIDLVAPTKTTVWYFSVKREQVKNR